MGNCCTGSVSFSCDQLCSRCWDCIAAEAIFVCQLKENIRALRTAKNELVAKQADVMERIDEQEKTGEMVRLQEVENWRNRVNDLVTEVDQLLETAAQETSRLCLGGCCSRSYISSHDYGKEVAAKLKEVRVENNKVFDPVVGPPPVTLVVRRNVGATVGIKATLDRAWELLMEEKVDTLGIWGMGGVGKSTLLEYTNNKFDEVKLGYFVIYVEVSRTFTIEKVRDDIAKRLGFPVDDEKWTSKSHQERVNAIFQNLHRKKFVLLLDDVWKKINLADEIGVPKERNGSKVVFTTRDGAVCGEMEAEKLIELQSLSWDLSWELFQQKVGEDTLNSHPDIPAKAQDVANFCAGLPIALITVGCSMSSKRTLQEWNHAIESLRVSASNFQGMDVVFALLKFSYESLPNDATRSCFLYCCLFPKKYKIAKCDLVDYWIGEEFCTSIGKGYDYIGSLVRACLLEEEGENYVKLHDLVRDMALGIACECQNENERFLVETGRESTEIQAITNWEAKRRVSLMDNRIESLEGAPNCPNLQTLFLCHNRIKEVVSATTGSFFQSMGALRVLDLSWNPYLSQTLSLETLKSLQYLNLSHTNIEELMPEFKLLVKLKCLNLENTHYLAKIPREVISSLSLLQVFKMYKCSYRLIVPDNNNILFDGNSVVVELQSLKHLNLLTSTIRHASSFEALSSDNRLLSCIQGLCLVDFEVPKSMNISPFANMPQLEELNISAIRMEEFSVDTEGIRRISVNKSFNNLQKVEVVECHHLLDCTWLVLLPNLKFLAMEKCESMREIISRSKFDQISAVHDQQILPFTKLEVLRLDTLETLESINSSPLHVPSLRELSVYVCHKLKKLPLNSNSVTPSNLVITGQNTWWESLEDETTKITFSSCFVSLFDEY